MKLEENMYVRTKNGIIAKYIDYKRNDDDIDFSTYNFDGKIYWYYEYYNNFVYEEDFEDWLEEEVVKASHNIIDLIQSKDLIVDTKNNLYVVDRVAGDYVYTTSRNQYGLIITLVDYQIKSILTKEMFESVSYKVGGNNEDRK